MSIGRVFHYTPLVEDLPKAEAFFHTFFAPHGFYRGYSPFWHRMAAILVVSDFVIEPLQPLAPVDDQPADGNLRDRAAEKHRGRQPADGHERNAGADALVDDLG